MKTMRKGISLIELVFACFLFLLCVGLIIGSFTGIARTYLQGNTKMEQQNNLRVVLDLMSSELREANNIVLAQPHVTTNGPKTSIYFTKYDFRKQAVIAVDYDFRSDLEGQPIVRTDYNSTRSTQYSQCEIGNGFSNVQFTITPDTTNTKINLIEIAVSSKDANDKVTTLVSTITPRVGNELLAVEAIGKHEPVGTSTLLNAAP